MGTRFNRYIVECKGCRIGEDMVPAPGFNRYIVECKVIYSPSASRRSDRFNRYIVECKGKKTDSGNQIQP